MSQKTAIDAPALTPELRSALTEWQKLDEWLTKAKKREVELRNTLAAIVDKELLTEGTNTIHTADGWEFKVDRKVNRTLDEAALDATMSELPEDSEFRRLGVLITYKPTLVLGGFRKMPEDQKLIFAQCLTEKDGLPGLEVKFVAPEGQPDTAPAVVDWPATNSKGPLMDGEPKSQKAKRTTNGKVAKAKRTK